MLTVRSANEEISRPLQNHNFHNLIDVYIFEKPRIIYIVETASNIYFGSLDTVLQQTVGL
jgi:hypothetical protein